MTSHDQLFKDLFEAFFGDLVRLVVPWLAARTRPDRARFLRDELFVDLPAGASRRLDLVAEVPARKGEPELVLVHVEIEGRMRRALERRMWRYAMQLRLRHQRPVVPLVVSLAGGPAGVERRVLVDELWGEELARFTYFVFGLRRAPAAEYLARPEPLAWALAALMQSAEPLPERKIACLRPIARADLSAARRFLLANCVETYLQLDDGERARYEELTEEEDGTMWIPELTWADRMRGEGARRVLVSMMTERFGELPEDFRQRLEQIEAPWNVEKIAKQLLDGRELDQIELPKERKRRWI